MARLGSAWLRESIPLTGVKQTAMLRRGNAFFGSVAMKKPPGCCRAMADLPVAFY
jgi:hypothetical protein